MGEKKDVWVCILPVYLLSPPRCPGGGCLALRLICLLGREHSLSSVIAQLLFPVLVVRECAKVVTDFNPVMNRNIKIFQPLIPSSKYRLALGRGSEFQLRHSKS